MAQKQKWYKNIAVIAAIVGGIFAVIAAIITVLPNRARISDLQRAENDVFDSLQIEKQYIELVSAYTKITDAYLQLSIDNKLTQAERDQYKKKYIITKTELQKYHNLVDEWTRRRIRAEATLEEFKKQLNRVYGDSLSVHKDKSQYEELYEDAKIQLHEQKVLFDSLTTRYNEANSELRRLSSMLNNMSLSTITVLLRNSSLNSLTEDDVKLMVRRKHFYHNDWNATGKGLENKYELKVVKNDSFVVDHKTGLAWQQSGSEKISYIDSEKYIRDLNKLRFGGYNDWRLPTLEEAMSLIEPTQSENMYFVNPIFSTKQDWIWTIDKGDTKIAWWVSFSQGYCGISLIDSDYPHIRAVRQQYIIYVFYPR